MKKFLVLLMVLFTTFAFADGTCLTADGMSIVVTSKYDGSVLMRTNYNTVVLNPTARSAFIESLKSNITALTTMQTEKIVVNRIAETSKLDTDYKNGIGLWIYLNTTSVGPYTLRVQFSDRIRESFYLTIDQANELIKILEDSMTKTDDYSAQQKRVDELIAGIK